MQQRFSLGIDLGTSNSAVALSEVDNDQTNIVEITQVLGPNQIGEKPTLPSALYIPHPDEFPEGAFPLISDFHGRIRCRGSICGFDSHDFADVTRRSGTSAP